MSKRLLSRLFLLVVLSPVTAGAADEKSFPGIEKLMSPEEFSASGLGKLSDDELQALDAWLLRYTAGDAAILRERDPEVREAVKATEIISRITGDFTGWNGETLFRLENGQVWRQRLQGKYRYNGPPNPEIRIHRNFLGFYMMTLVEEDKSVGVKLVR
jgi:hypothetical protein